MKNNKVMIVAKVFPNFNFCFIKRTKGLAIKQRISEIIKYKITVFIWYKKYNEIHDISIKAIALSIPFAIILDVIICN